MTPRITIPKHREVYVLETTGACKVGISWRASQRVRSVQTNMPTPVRLVAAFPIASAYVLAAETEAHRQLAEHRIQGEWFRVSPEVACTAVEDAIARVQGLQAHRRTTP